MSQRRITNDRQSSDGRHGSGMQDTRGPRHDERRKDGRHRSGREDDGSRSRHERMNNGGTDVHRIPGGRSGGIMERSVSSFTGEPIPESELMGDLPKKKFTGRCRLFVGNIPNDLGEEELKEMFKPYGEVSECFVSGKGFAFLRLDTRANAESAKEAIDGNVVHGRQIRVRFAVHGAALRVKELPSSVSNEMLYHAFSHFGDVERAVHIVDEKGRPTGEGIVEFERKPSCTDAVTAIRDKVFLLTSSPKPLAVEVIEPKDEDDGLAERMIPRTARLIKERERGPRFPARNTFEYVYGMKWKELYEMEKERKRQLEDEFREARRRLGSDMELAYEEYQAQMLREDLQRRQEELERLESRRQRHMRANGYGGPEMMRQDGPPLFDRRESFDDPMRGPRAFGGPMGGPRAFGDSFGGPMMGGHLDDRYPPYARGPRGPDGLPRDGSPMPPGVEGPGGHLGFRRRRLSEDGEGPEAANSRSGQAGEVVEGVHRLLQIFKSDSPGRPRPLGGGMQPDHPFGRGGTAGPFLGGPGSGDYPPEKRMRR